MLWLALHFPALSLESWAATLAPADDAPLLALQHEHHITQASAAARARGVRPGMRRATALALVPELRLGQADALRDVRALRAVAHVALQFSPSVAWATPPDWCPLTARPGQASAAAGEAEARDADELNPDDTPPQPASSPALVGVRLEVQSCLRLHGGLAALLARLRAALAQVLPGMVRLRIASAPTALGAALLAAWRADLEQGPHSTDLAALQPLLDPLPLHLLGPGRRHWAALQGMGLRRLGDLAGLPRAGLARRFGPELLADIDGARGQAPEAQRWLGLPAQFHSRLELQARADTSAQMLHGAQLLLARLLAWARARQVAIVRFTLRLHHEPRWLVSADSPASPCTDLAIAPAQPSAEAAHLALLLAERLGALALPAPALELSLLCQATAAAAPPSAELFADAGQASAASRQQGLARLVERLQARLGRERVQRLGARAERRPELATCWQPADPARLLAPLPATLAESTAELLALARQALPAQPVWLLPQPQALAERDGLPLHQGRGLQLLAGPERLETGWWDGALVLRDYFIAQHDGAGSGLLWVFRSHDAHRPGWYLQGLFA